MVKIGLSLNESLVYEVRQYCKSHGKTLSGFFSEAASAALELEAARPALLQMVDALKQASEAATAGKLLVEQQTSLYEKKPT